MPEEKKPMPPAATPGAAGQQQAPAFSTDYSELSTVYTNFCRVNVTPEELVLDFGLNTQMTPNPTEPVKLTHRVVMNFYTAKRLFNALGAVLQQHERSYGVLELDFQRRARGAGAGGAGGAGGGGGAPGGTPPAAGGAGS